MIPALYLIVILLPLIGWCMVVAWSPAKPEGEPLLDVPMTLLARLKMLAIPMGGTLALAVGFWVTGLVPWLYAVLAMACLLVVVSLPVSYHLTTDGLRTGRGQFRRWTEFAGVQRSATGAVLQGTLGKPSYPIFLSRNRDDDEFVLTLKHLVRDSYKGKVDTETRIRESGRG